MVAAETPDPEITWSEVQDFAFKTGFTAREVIEYFHNVLHARALKES